MNQHETLTYQKESFRRCGSHCLDPSKATLEHRNPTNMKTAEEQVFAFISSGEK